LTTQQRISIFKWLSIVIIFFSSCKTVKYIEKEKIVIDSTYKEENTALFNLLKETKEKYQKEKEQWENTGVVFETTPCPDTANKSPAPITKIIFDNGKLKSIEGNVKALNQSLYEKSSELLDAYSTIDSMGVELEKKEIELSKKQTIVYKEIKKTFIPWWVWLIAGLALVVGTFFPTVKKFIKLKFNV